jgi:hypothetical protein
MRKKAIGECTPFIRRSAKGAPAIFSDPKIQQLAWDYIDEEFMRLARKHGPRVGKAPRSSVISHEVGHVVVGVHDGATGTSAEISRCKCGGWTGLTKWDSHPARSGAEQVSPREVLLHICTLIAGIVGEEILSRGGRRPGSAIDEAVVAEMLAEGLTEHSDWRDVSPQRIMDGCYRRTKAIILANKRIARAISAELNEHGVVRRKQIQRLTEKIRRVEDDPIRTAFKHIRAHNRNRNGISWALGPPETMIRAACKLGWQVDPEMIVQNIWDEHPDGTPDEVKRAFMAAKRLLRCADELGWTQPTNADARVRIP